MVAAAEIPVRVESEAMARIKQLGMEREFQAMLDHTKGSISDLKAIEVRSYDDPDEPNEPRVRITAIKDGPGIVGDPSWTAWGHWFVRAFPPDVCRWFGFDVEYVNDHGR